MHKKTRLDFSVLFTGVGLFYLLILTSLEIVLGIDNIIFISIVTDKLPKETQRKARILGLTLALVVRLGLLSIVSWIMGMTKPLFNVFNHDFSGQSFVLLLGGIFLIYKAAIEMYENIKGHEAGERKEKTKLSSIILQIILIDIVFSFDSIITAIGMTNDIQREIHHNPLIIIYVAVIISMIVMLIFAKPISDFINSRPTIKMIALGFLVTIGIVLVVDAFGIHISKGYIYFAMGYALVVEFLNIKMRKNKCETE